MCNRKKSLHFISTLLFFLIYSCSEEFSSKYPNISDAKLGIEKGWIPSILPSSSFNISESHDLDTNHGSGSFDFKSDNEIDFYLKLTEIDTNKASNWMGKFDELKSKDNFFEYRIRGFFIEVNWKTHHGRFQIMKRR